MTDRRINMESVGGLEWLLLVPFYYLGGGYGAYMVLASEEKKNTKKVLWKMLFELWVL